MQTKEYLEYKTPFHMVANDIYEMGLNPYQLAVYGYICRCGNNSKAFPSYNTIAIKTGMSRSKAISTMNELLELNLIVKVVRKKSNTENDSNIYEVKIPSVQDTPPSVCDALPSVQDTPNKELSNNNYIKKDIGNFDEQNPAITFYDLQDMIDIDDNVMGYINLYESYTPNNSYYKYNTWLEIIDNLSDIEYSEIEDIDNIVKKYLATKFNQPHSLYHSSLENVLSNRMYECNVM